MVTLCHLVLVLDWTWAKEDILRVRRAEGGVENWRSAKDSGGAGEAPRKERKTTEGAELDGVDVSNRSGCEQFVGIELRS